jgi:peptidoglycan/LPS O-acetylase OafA/YrhL
MKHIQEFEGLRGLMAWWVVIGHWSTTAPIPYTIGSTKLFNGYAVDVFIILSGFAIAALLDKRPEPYGLYIARRFLRIFPVYLLFLFLSVAASSLALEVWAAAPEGYMKATRIQIAKDSLDQFWPHLFAHFTALHGVIPPAVLPNTDYAFLGQAWSISLEWQFYLLAPLLIPAIDRLRSLRALVAMLPFIILLALLSRFMPAGFLVNHLHLFLLGILSFTFLKRRFSGDVRFQVPVAAVLAIALPFLVLIQTFEAIPYVIWLTMMALIIATREHDSARLRRLSALFNHPYVQKIGQMSYSVYLSHMLVIILSLKVLEGRGLDDLSFSAVLLVMTVVGTMLLSSLSFRMVEQPFHKLGRSLRGTQARTEPSM